jgi:hypothetical protein
MFKKSVWFRIAVLASMALVFSMSLFAPKASADQTIAANSFIYLPLITRTVPAVRIESGSDSSYTDTQGNVWQADTGAIDGNKGDFGNIAIANTSDPRIYQTEHYELTGYTFPVVNGYYTVRLHFAENYYSTVGQRILNVNVEGSQINNLDVLSEAGGAHRALIKTVSVVVTDGQLNLSFAASVGQTMINGIEILSP